jgi:hypothetical protein
MFKELDNFRQIGFSDCHMSERAKWLDSGTDSDVYKFGEDMVVKKYRVEPVNGYYPFLNKATLQNYFDVTNNVYRAALENPFNMEFPFSGKQYQVRINPIFRMGDCERCGGYESVSPFVAGPRLDQLKYFCGPREMHIALVNLSEKIGTFANYEGISVIPKNIKQVDDGSFVITDLCSDIRILRPKYFND